MSNETDRLLAESKIQDIKDVFKKYASNDSFELKQLRLEFKKLQEEISSSDWSKIGMLAGLLWYKLDTIVNHLANIDRNTSKIK